MKKPKTEKPPKAKTPSGLVEKGTNGSKKPNIELTEGELDKTTGGAFDTYLKFN